MNQQDNSNPDAPVNNANPANAAPISNTVPTGSNASTVDENAKLLATKRIILGFILLITIAIAVAAFFVAQKIRSESNNTTSSDQSITNNSSSIPKYTSNTTASVTPTASPKVSPTISPTPTPTPTPSTTQSKLTSSPTTQKTLTCGTMTFTQNSAGVTSVNAGSSTVIITATINPSTSGANLDYTNASWTVNPSSGQSSLTIPNTGNYATWTPPSTLSQSQTYTFSINGVTDSNGGTLSSPCSGSLLVNTAAVAQNNPTPTPAATPDTLAQNNAPTPTPVLPNTGNNSYSYIILILSALLAIGFIISAKKAGKAS